MYQQLSLSHPRIYRRMLYVCMAAVLISGGVNALAPWIARAQFEYRDVPPRSSVVVVNPSFQGSTASVELPASLSAYRPDTSTISPVDLGRKINAAWFGDQYWPALQALWTRESGFNPNAINRSSGACGIPQALPCSKIADHSTTGQITWGLGYIQSRYGNPANAWRFWQTHRWY